MEGTIGFVIPWAPNFAPRNWLFCDGQLLSISQNTALFAILGTTYGGDGRTTFGIPDLRGRIAIGDHGSTGPGLTPIRLGEQGGVETVVLSEDQMPAHGHSGNADVLLEAANAQADFAVPGPTLTVARPNFAFGDVSAYSGDSPDTTLDGAGMVTDGPVTVEPSGGAGAHDNVQPYLALNYIICVQGIFPSRN